MHLTDAKADTGDPCPVCDDVVLGVIAGASPASKLGWIDGCISYPADGGAIYYLHGTLGNPPEADS
jgi:hypothetical protein